MTYGEIYERIMGRLDPADPPEDEELQSMIESEIRGLSHELYIPLKDRVDLGRAVFHSFRRLDLLQELLEDGTVTEIMVNGADRIFVERRGRIEATGKSFASQGKLADVVQQIAADSNKSVNEYTPIADARLSDGSRVNIVLPPVALNGPVITIRKFPERSMTMADLINSGTISSEAASDLEILVKSRFNIFISGGTGAGKTTFLNVLSEFIPEEERIITIEDTAELRLLDKPDLVRLEARGPNPEGGGEISIRDLIRTALRMRPDRIIVGEVRSGEALDMIQAMNTGHDGSLSTGHANSPADMLSRLETMVLMSGVELPLAAVQRQLSSAIDIIIHVGRTADKSRRVLSIVEVEGITEGVINLNELYVYKKGRLHKTGTVRNTYKLEQAGYAPGAV